MNVFLITSSYPYSGSSEESFIDPELRAIYESGITKKINIFIVPLSNKGEWVGNVPADIKVVDWFIDKKSNNKIEKLFIAPAKVLSSFEFYKLLIERLTDGTRSYRQFFLDIKSILYFTYYYIEFKHKIKSIMKKTKDPFGIYTYWFDAHTSAWLDCQEYFKNKMAFVVTRTHGFDVYDWRTYHPRRKKDIQLITKIFPASNHGRNYLVNKYGFAEKVEMFHLGVEKYSCISKKEIPENNCIKILSCSLILPVKRIPLLAEGIIELANQNKDKRIIWTHLGDGPEKSKVFKVVESVKTENLLFDFRGFVKNNFAREIMHNEFFHCIINVSESEGLPVSLMEATEAKIPLIATDVGGSSEIVKDVGILLSPNPEPKEIASAISFGYKDFKHLSVKSYKKWQSDFNSYKNHIAFWNNLISLIPPPQAPGYDSRDGCHEAVQSS